MARARNIKPGFYKNEDLAECSIWARYIFPGLWMLADREGRLEDRPKRIKGELLPFDSQEAEPLLSELETRGFLVRYQNSDGSFIQISKFNVHQTPHYSEKQSVIKAPTFPESEAHQGSLNQEKHQKDGAIKGGSQPPDSLIPDSLIPDSLIPDSLIPDSPKRAEARATRLPADWALPAEWKLWALKEQPTWTPQHCEKVAQTFRNYWIAKAGRDGAKLDWRATWHNWVIKEGPMDPKRAPRRPLSELVS